MQQNLALIGSVKYGGIDQVRIHDLLDAVEYISPKKYNSTLLIEFLDRIKEVVVNIVVKIKILK